MRKILKHGGGGGRAGQSLQQGQKLVVGMKLTPSSRELLAWVIAKLAQSGDHILAVHVSAFSARHAGTYCQLGNSLKGVLSVYEGLCNLKRVKLQLEIVRGSTAKKALVEVAGKQVASKLVLGSNKHLSSGHSTELGTYCLKRLPSTCTVIIVEHSLIVFDKQGCLENEAPNQSDDEPAVFSQRTLPQCQTSFSLFMKKLPGDKTSRNRESPGSNAKENSGLTPGWPLMHNAIGFDRKPVLAPGIERSMSVVNWALQLPGRSRHKGSLTLPRGAVEAQCDKLLGELSSKAFTTSMRSSINMGFARTLQENISTLAQQVECLCLERPCTWFSYDQLKAATSNFSPSKIIGRGGASQVYKGQTQDGKLVAVKCLNQGGRQAEEELLTDIQITCSLSHVNIVTLLGYCVDTPHMILVYDYIAQGSLDDHLHGRDEEAPLPWNVRHQVAVGVAEALDYIQGGCPRPVIHRDVKASNILLTEDFEPRLSDFGLAKWGPTNAPHIPCNDVVGTFGYLAPEYFMYGKVNDKTDVYSFGVVLLELITGRTPIDTSRPKGQENLVTWASPLLEERNLEKLVDPQLKAVGMYDLNEMESMVLAASLCVQQSAPRRPSMSQVLKILCGDQSEDLSTFQRREARLSVDLDDTGCTLDDEDGKVDMQTHMALAMLGVDDDDDVTSQCSTDLAHSNVFLEEYLEGRYTRSSSFDN
ncbi:unnamed protein product [Sphagnum troendelagicum]|uniref:Protein kinase domain-containing protein n=1 Tax=Sphagnum troendelagicum TaxID=128251 RepID=A0ABP0U836_9BRYO